MHRKEMSYLCAILYWPLQDGWGGGAGAGKQSDAQGQKYEMIIASILNTQTAVNKTQKLRSPVLTGIRLLYLMLVVMLTALLPRFHRSDGSEKAAPRLASKPWTDSRRAGCADRGKPLLLFTDSASHTAELSINRGPYTMPLRD